MKRALALALALAFVTAGLFADAGAIRRFALVAGSNIGGKSTANLKYATNDAKRMRDVLVRIGGIKEEDSMLLINPEKDSLSNALSFMGTKLRKARGAGAQPQFVFYYSGHSDERGLLLFGEYFDYRELRESLDALGAEVRVVVLDSCSSGAFTREKGGSIAAPFLLDESASVEGHAYITSSTAEEASQESDRIESSFFTHFLLNGLRGAADADGDGKVNLGEAYGYAYDRTLSETEKTRSGAQHPAFDFKLNGMGNLVLTDLREGEAVLKLPKELIGKLSLRDVSDKLVLEIRKSDGKEMRVGVEQGYYRIVLEEGKDLLETVLIVDERKEYELRREGFKGIAAASNALRGTGASPFSFFPLGFSIASAEGGSALYLNVLGGKAAAVDGLMLSFLFNRTVGTSSGYQGSSFANIAGGDFHGMQGSLGVNIAQGDLFGVQASPLFNEVGGNLKGLQLSIFNHAGANLMIGQAGLINVAAGEGGFFQLGALNLSQKEIRGLQVGALNIGNVVTGLQVGLVNFSEDQTGVQLGLINVSKRLDGLPIGIIDVQFNGENHIDALIQSSGKNFDSLDDGLFATGYFRFGSRYFYKYFEFGMPIAAGGTASAYPPFLAGAGAGFRIPAFFEGFAFHLDAGANYHSAAQRIELVQDPDFLSKVVPQFRLWASCRIFGNMGLIAGLEQWVYTKYFHDVPEGFGDFEILTEYGKLLVDSRFFAGIQL